MSSMYPRNTRSFQIKTWHKYGQETYYLFLELSFLLLSIPERFHKSFMTKKRLITIHELNGK